jgi:hypothetical protein
MLRIIMVKVFLNNFLSDFLFFRNDLSGLHLFKKLTFKIGNIFFDFFRTFSFGSLRTIFFEFLLIYFAIAHTQERRCF